MESANNPLEQNPPGGQKNRNEGKTRAQKKTFRTASSRRAAKKRRIEREAGESSNATPKPDNPAQLPLGNLDRRSNVHRSLEKDHCHARDLLEECKKEGSLLAETTFKDRGIRGDDGAGEGPAPVGTTRSPEEEGSAREAGNTIPGSSPDERPSNQAL